MNTSFLASREMLPSVSLCVCVCEYVRVCRLESSNSLFQLPGEQSFLPCFFLLHHRRGEWLQHCRREVWGKPHRPCSRKRLKKEKTVLNAKVENDKNCVESAKHVWKQVNSNKTCTSLSPFCLSETNNAILDAVMVTRITPEATQVPRVVLSHHPRPLSGCCREGGHPLPPVETLLGDPLHWTTVRGHRSLQNTRALRWGNVMFLTIGTRLLLIQLCEATI